MGSAAWCRISEPNRCDGQHEREHHCAGAADDPQGDQGRKTVVTPNGEVADVVRTRADPTLLKALARRVPIGQKLLDDGRFVSISELAAAEEIERGFLGKMLRLTLLAPDPSCGDYGWTAGFRGGSGSVASEPPSVWAKQAAGAKTRRP